MGLEHANWVTSSQSDHAIPKVYLIWKSPATARGIKGAPSPFRHHFEFFCAFGSSAPLLQPHSCSTFNCSVRRALAFSNDVYDSIYSALKCFVVVFPYRWELFILIFFKCVILLSSSISL